jgi:hypothetical protein
MRGATALAFLRLTLSVEVLGISQEDVNNCHLAE